MNLYFRQAIGPEERKTAKRKTVGVVALLGLLIGLFCFILASSGGHSSGRLASERSEAFYRVAPQNGVWWLLAPEGKPFFSLGVNCVDRGALREKYRPERPEYAAFRHYADDSAWAKETQERLRGWGFNTLGGWCDVETLNRTGSKKMPYTVVLHLGASSLVPWSDIFGADVARQFDERAKRLIAPCASDPALIGYFSDNELGWWDDTIFLYFLQQPAQNATRQVLMRLMREHYGGDFARLQRDFHTGQTNTFAELEQKASLTLKNGGNGIQVIDKFVAAVAERYYRLSRDSIRRYDHRHLFLGDRYANWYPQAVSRAAGRYVDVVSTNYSADWLNGENAHFYLDSLYRLTGRPLLITEFYFCAQENRSGNKNSSAGFPTVATQQERVDGFRTNLRAYAVHPAIVGAHWFQFYDEPTYGRGDGEDYNMGLVDIKNRPYQSLTAVSAALPVMELHRRASERKSNTPLPAAKEKSIFVPLAPANPEVGLTSWNKTQGFVSPASSTAACADLYACWDRSDLYLAVYAADYVDAKLYPNGVLPAQERMEWTLFLGKQPPLHIRFGPGGKAVVDGSEIVCKAWSRATRFTALVRLPVALWGKDTWQNGDTLPLKAILTTHSRAERMEWNTLLRLEKRRTRQR